MREKRDQFIALSAPNADDLRHHPTELQDVYTVMKTPVVTPVKKKPRTARTQLQNPFSFFRVINEGDDEDDEVAEADHLQDSVEVWHGTHSLSKKLG